MDGIDRWVMDFMEGYAKDMGVSVPEMLMRVFIRRVAKDGAFNHKVGEVSPEFEEDVYVIGKMREEYDFELLYGALVFHYVEKFNDALAKSTPTGDRSH